MNGPNTDLKIYKCMKYCCSRFQRLVPTASTCKAYELWHREMLILSDYYWDGRWLFIYIYILYIKHMCVYAHIQIILD